MVLRRDVLAAAAVFACCASTALAQGVGHSPILGMSKDDMRREVDQRYDAALKLTLSPEIVNADDPRYTWASEAKAACGIAHGYLKSGQVDEWSINRCDDASHRMTVVWTAPPPPPPPRPPPPEAPACTVTLPIVFYFAFDDATPPADAAPVAQATVAGMAACGWSGLTVTGHTDRSGSDSYNMALSERRAEHVRDLLTSVGASAASVNVVAKGESSPAKPTPDGVKEPLNRRVEVTPAGGQ